MSHMTFTPASDAPDWLIVIRATWCEGQLRVEAAREALRCGIELSANPRRNALMIGDALIADRAAA